MGYNGTQTRGHLDKSEKAFPVNDDHVFTKLYYLSILWYYLMSLGFGLDKLDIRIGQGSFQASNIIFHFLNRRRLDIILGSKSTDLFPDIIAVS